MSAQSPATVGLLGGASMRALAGRLEATPGSVRIAQGIDAVRQAKPPLVLFVVNAPDGPMPANREALQFMSQAGIRNFAIVFTETEKIHDPELFGLIVSEVVDVIRKAGLPGDQAPVFLDSDTIKTSPKLTVRKGVRALREFIEKGTLAAAAPETAVPPRPSACALIGEHEMSRILGGAVGIPTAEDRGDSTTCTYTPAAGKGLTPYAQVKIDWIAGGAGMAGMNLANRAFSKDAGFSVAERIDGVGDEASMMIGGVMSVRKGAMLLTIDLRLQPRPKEKGVAIARSILAHVPDAK